MLSPPMCPMWNRSPPRHSRRSMPSTESRRLNLNSTRADAPMGIHSARLTVMIERKLLTRRIEECLVGELNSGNSPPVLTRPQASDICSWVVYLMEEEP